MPSYSQRWKGGCVMGKAKKPKARIHQLTVAQFERMFPHDDACKTYLVAQRWPAGVCCPKCGSLGVKPHGTMAFHWLCNDCSEYATNYRFSVTVGTIFENT